MKNRGYTIFIVGVILILMGYMMVCLNDDEPVQAAKRNGLQPQYVNVQPKEIEEKDNLFQFSLNILEETLKGKIALVDPKMTTIEEDGYNRYFLKVESIGINNRQVVDLYHFYFILQKSEENELYMMPFGLEVLVGNVDNVKEDILISMLKLTNEWETNHIKN